MSSDAMEANFIRTGPGHLTLIREASCLSNRRGLISKMAHGRYQRIKRAIGEWKALSSL